MLAVAVCSVYQPNLTYTFYPVRWATQKGNILRVRAPKVAQLGGGTDFFFVRAWPTSRGPAQNRGGGHYYSCFKFLKLPKTCFKIEIVDDADFPSLCLQVHTVIFVQNTTPSVRAIFRVFFPYYETHHTTSIFEKRLKYPLSLVKSKKK